MEFSPFHRCCPLQFHRGPVWACGSIPLLLALEKEHTLPRALRGSRFPTFSPSWVSQHFLVPEANLPWTHLWAALGCRISRRCFSLVFIDCIGVSCQHLPLLAVTVPSLTWDRSSRDVSWAQHRGHWEAVTLLVSPGWFGAGRPRLFPSVTFLHVRFHLLFLFAYVCFAGVLLRVKWLTIYKWREIIQTACDLMPPF